MAMDWNWEVPDYPIFMYPYVCIKANKKQRKEKPTSSVQRPGIVESAIASSSWEKGIVFLRFSPFSSQLLHCVNCFIQALDFNLPTNK